MTRRLPEELRKLEGHALLAALVAPFEKQLRTSRYRMLCRIRALKQRARRAGRLDVVEDLEQLRQDIKERL